MSKNMKIGEKRYIGEWNVTVECKQESLAGKSKCEECIAFCKKTRKFKCEFVTQKCGTCVALKRDDKKRVYFVTVKGDKRWN